MAEAGHEEDDRLSLEARAWVVRLTSGEATDADAWRLSAWRRQSAGHEAAYREAVRLWRTLAPLARGQAALDLTRRRDIARRRALICGTAAAAFGGLFLGAERLRLIPSLGALLAEYRTGTGEQRRVTLADGSVVEMNTRTSLTARYSDAERRVDLVEGEAIFTVKPDPARPFMVGAAGGETHALGTVFAVRRDEGAVCVSCLFGKLAVERIQRAELRSGEQVAYSRRGLEDVRAVASDMVDGWRRGVLVFRDAKLRQVVAELNRYRPGLVILASGAEAERHVSGVFHLDRLDEALGQIERAGGLRAVSFPGHIVILR